MAAAALLGLVDLAVPSGRLSASSPLAGHAFEGYQPAAPDGTRRGDGASVIHVRGLWPGATVQGALEIAARGGPRRVRVLANGDVVADTPLGDVRQRVPFTARASDSGVLEVRVQGGRRAETVFRLAELRFRQTGPRTVAAGHLLRYLLLGACLALVAGRAAGGRAGAWITAALLILAAIAVAAARGPWFACLDATVLVATLAAATALAADAFSAWTRCPRWASWPVMAILVARGALVADPGFGSIDAQWHAGNLGAFAAEGRLVESQAPGVARSPYPPAFYALAAAFRTGDLATDVRTVRLLMAALEGATPLLVFGIASASGLAPAAAGAAALVAACLPEGTLVLAKGIAANVLGQFATLVCVLLFARRGTGHAARLCALALLMLSHAGSAALGLALLAAWWLLGLRQGTLSRTGLLRRVGLVAGAAAVAWAVYYREVPLVLGDPSRGGREVPILDPHWYRAGKIAQDLVLKFGALPVVVGAAAFGSAWRSLHLGPLAGAWALAAATFAAVAVATPFPLRFEYFAAPLVALLCGTAAAASPAWRRAALASAGCALAIQAAVAAAWRAGRFEIIAVIMESPRWPFPFTR